MRAETGCATIRLAVDGVSLWFWIALIVDLCDFSTLIYLSHTCAVVRLLPWCSWFALWLPQPMAKTSRCCYNLIAPSMSCRGEAVPLRPLSQRATWRDKR